MPLTAKLHGGPYHDSSVELAVDLEYVRAFEENGELTVHLCTGVPTGRAPDVHLYRRSALSTGIYVFQP